MAYDSTTDQAWLTLGFGNFAGVSWNKPGREFDGFVKTSSPRGPLFVIRYQGAEQYAGLRFDGTDGALNVTYYDIDPDTLSWGL